MEGSVRRGGRAPANPDGIRNHSGNRTDHARFGARGELAGPRENPGSPPRRSGCPRTDLLVCSSRLLELSLGVRRRASGFRDSGAARVLGGPDSCGSPPDRMAGDGSRREALSLGAGGLCRSRAGAVGARAALQGDNLVIRREKLAVGLFLLLVVTVFFDPLFLRRNFCGRDLLGYHLPIENAVHDAYQRGRLPVWISEISGGRPLAANPNVGAFYPVRPLLSLFPFPLAMRIYPVVHWVFSGVGMILLLRLIGVSASG